MADAINGVCSENLTPITYGLVTRFQLDAGALNLNDTIDVRQAFAYLEAKLNATIETLALVELSARVARGVVQLDGGASEVLGI